jgi:hypothetical protein
MIPFQTVTLIEEIKEPEKQRKAVVRDFKVVTEDADNPGEPPDTEE